MRKEDEGSFAPASMAVLGDSLAQGRADPDPAGGWIGWSRRLAAELGIPEESVVNVAAEGATAVSVAREQLPAVRDMQPDVIVLSCGMNDVLVGIDETETESALSEIIRWGADSDSLVLLASLPTPPIVEQPVLSRLRKKRILQRVELFNNVLGRLSSRFGVPLIGPDVLADISNPDLWGEDGIHLNSAGHVYVSKILSSFVLRHPEVSSREGRAGYGRSQ